MEHKINKIIKRQGKIFTYNKSSIRTSIARNLKRTKRKS